MRSDQRMKRTPIPGTGWAREEQIPGEDFSWNVVYSKRAYAGRYAQDEWRTRCEEWPGLPCGDDDPPLANNTVRFRRFSGSTSTGLVVAVVRRFEGRLNGTRSWDWEDQVSLHTTRSVALLEVAVPATAEFEPSPIRLVWPEDATPLAALAYATAGVA